MPGTVAYSVALALGVSAFAAFGIYAVCKSHMWKMRLVLLVKTTSILCCVFTGVFAFRFIRDADSMKRSTMLQAGAGGGAWQGTSPIEATDDVYKQMESFLCNTYRSCCEPKEFLDLRAASGGERRCGTPQRGMAEDAAAILSDPSHAQFCALVSGVGAQFKASPGACRLLEEVADEADEFSLEGCQERFCQVGLEGYEDFMSVAVNALRANARMIALVYSVFVVLLLVQVTNLYNIMHHASYSARMEDWEQRAGLANPGVVMGRRTE